VQPERDGRIQCLECGRWYQLLGNHLRQSHAMTVDEYKEEHGLPASRGLVPEQLREIMAANQRRRLATEPGLREALTNDRATLEAWLRAGREAAARTRHRAGVRANLVESARVAGEKRSKEIRAGKDALARELGYADLRDLLQQTAHLPAHRVGPMIGESQVQVRKWRGKYGIDGTAREQNALERRAAREAGLADVPPGVQPAQDGRLRCLECGRWYANLAGHLAAHGLTPGGYRARHDLAPHTSLMGEARRAAAPAAADPARGRIPYQRDKLDASRALANRARAEQTKARHDARARELGYRDLTHFLTATAGQPLHVVAATFGITAGRLRAARPFAPPTDRAVPADGPAPVPTSAGPREETPRAPRKARRVAGLQVRNLKDERPRGFSWDDAVGMLAQGLTVADVAERTGFPVGMLAHEARKSR
jgi:predicted transcriptional regulator